MSYRRRVQLTSDILIAFEHHLLLTACEVLNNAIAGLQCHAIKNKNRYHSIH